MEFRLLGPFEVIADGQVLRLSGAMVPSVLATLLMNANRTVTTERLIETAWPKPPPNVRSNVRTYIARLRRALVAAGEPDSRVVTELGGYRLALSPGELDLAIFEELAAAGEKALARADVEIGLDRLRRAIDLWRGQPLEGLVGGPQWGVELARLEERRVAVTERWADAALAAGRHDEVSTELARLIRVQPLREQIWVRLMLALYRGGRQAAALAAYQEVFRLLDRELGIAPGRPLQRLHHQILTADPALDLTQPAPASAAVRMPVFRPPIPRQLPPDVPTFAGRVEHLEALDALLHGDQVQQPSVAAISGMPGVGKTALAVHWAHRVADRLADGQLYVNLRGFDPGGCPVDPGKVIRGFLAALGVPPERVPADLDAQSALYRSLLASRRVLVVLDNARDAEQVRPLLPGVPHCPVVVTSRNQLTGLVAAVAARPISLDLLTADEAQHLLACHLGDVRVEAERRAVDDIVALCGRLPLALTVVAARAAIHPCFPLRALADELGETRGSLDPFIDGDPATDLRNVFSWSYQALDAETARLFRLLGTHVGPDISIPAAASLAGVPAGQIHPLLARLVRVHLLTEPRPGRFCFHDLLRTYASELAQMRDPEAERRAAAHRLFDHYLHAAYAADRLLDPQRDRITLVPPEPGVTVEEFADRGQAVAWFTAEYGVLLAVVREAARTGFHTQAWQLSWALAMFMDGRDRSHDFVAIHRLALDAADRLADPVAQAHTHRMIGRASARLGRDADAHTHLRQALELFGRLGDQVGQARTHLGLSWVAERQGDVRLALSHDLSALALFRAAGHRTGQARALNSAGWDYAELGDYQQAIAHCGQALVLQRELGDRRGEADASDSLGYVHHRLGQYPRAVSCYRRALELFQALDSRYYEAETLTRLGDTHAAAGDRPAAHDAWRQALDILEDLGHPDAGQVRSRLGRCG